MSKELPRQVENGLRELSHEDVPPFHMAKNLAGMRSQLERRTKVKKSIYSTFAGIGVMAVLAFTLMFIPASYTAKVGSLIKINVPLSGNISQSEIVEVISNLDDIVNSNLELNDNVLTLSLASRNPDSENVEENIVKQFKQHDIYSDEMNISAETITRKVGSNAFAALTGGYFYVKINGHDDAQLESAIMEALSEQGIQNSNVQITSSNDQKIINIEFEPGEGDIADGEEKTYEFHFEIDEEK